MTRETDGGARVNCPEVTVWFILPDMMRTDSNRTVKSNIFSSDRTLD